MLICSTRLGCCSGLPFSQDRIDHQYAERNEGQKRRGSTDDARKSFKTAGDKRDQEGGGEQKKYRIQDRQQCKNDSAQGGNDPAVIARDKNAECRRACAGWNREGGLCNQVLEEGQADRVEQRREKIEDQPEEPR